MKIIRTTLIALLLVNSGYAQQKPQTVAEQSGYTATSTHADVLGFIDELAKSTNLLKVETIATTPEGRQIPLLIIGDPLPQSPSELGNRVVVYIQANIHSGEVEGKEASLMYIRNLLQNNNRDVLKNTVLLVCPNLNADGNDRISKMNRTNQNGPTNGVGTRHNSLFLDMNRDAMKLETAEMQGVITNVLNKWDPAVVMDCHTTNGSFHQEPVTFTWMMNPNGDRTLINYMRDKMMPTMSRDLASKHNTLNCFYGEFINQRNYEQGWISYASEPRYFTNYVGLRNRLSILNENYVYADYRERVMGCYNLIACLMDYSNQHWTEIKQQIAQADSRTLRIANSEIDSFALTYTGIATPQKVTILTYEAEPYKDTNGRERFRKTDRKRTVTIPYIADYVATRSIAFPHAYIIKVNDPKITELLEMHGIEFEILPGSITLQVEQFTPDSIKPAARLNQGHYTNTVYGKLAEGKVRFEKGSILVKTSQKLGRLAAYLLEPQSDDGLLFWNYWDKYLVPQWGSYYYTVPVYRVPTPDQL